MPLWIPYVKKLEGCADGSSLKMVSRDFLSTHLAKRSICDSLSDQQFNSLLIFKEYSFWVIDNSGFEVCFTQKQDIFSEFLLYVLVLAGQKNFCSEKTVGRLIAKIPIKKQYTGKQVPCVLNLPAIHSLIAGENHTFSSINSALKAKVIMKLFSLIKDLEVMKGLGSLEANLFDCSDKCFVVPSVSYSQLNVV